MTKHSSKKINFISSTTDIHFKQFPSEYLAPSLNLLVYGIKALVKTAYSKKAFQPSFFYIHEDDADYLQRLSPKASYNKSRLDLKSIRNMTDDPSFDTKLNKRFQKSPDLELLLFISYGNYLENKFLIIKFPDLYVKRSFWQGMQYFQKKARDKAACFGDSRKLIAKKLFLKADKDGNKKLCINEVKGIMQKLQMNINHNFLTVLFQHYDENKSKFIDLEEFQRLIDDISLKPELEDLFKKYCYEAQHNPELHQAQITFLEFQEFLMKEQKQGINEQEFSKLVYYFHSDYKTIEYDENNTRKSISKDTHSKKFGLNFSEFCSFIFSKNNEIFEPDKLEIYQDMTKPLTNYYINSSHNTYLLSNQLTGESSTKAYVSALALGCRCVELDCWNGDKGEPIIYHGFTLTSKILFRDVLQTLKEYAFITNPYPVILSLENHCSKEQQDKMAKYFLEIFGDSIYLLPDEFEEWKSYPSPEELKYKFILKDKSKLPDARVYRRSTKLISSGSSPIKFDWNLLEKINYFDYQNDESYILSKECNMNSINILMEGNFPRTSLMPSGNTNLSTMIGSGGGCGNGLDKYLVDKKIETVEIPDRFNGFMKNSKEENMVSSSSKCKESIKLSSQEIFGAGKILNEDLLSSSKDKSFSKSSKQAKSHDQKISSNLKELLAMFGIPMDLKQIRSIWNISSIKETRFLKILKNKAQINLLPSFTRNYFLRVYPAGMRVDSSNYDPIACFNAGVQLVALNFQTFDINLLLYMSRFKQNGGKSCGYVLKPDCLMFSSSLNTSNSSQITKILCLQVLSGQQLKLEGEENDNNGVLNPYVEVGIRASDIDEKENKIYKSKPVVNNGFNPIFNMECQFKLSSPNLAFLVFKVFHQSSVGLKDLKIGWYAIPYECLRPGYRLIPMLDDNFKPIEFSYILCKITLKDVVDEN